MSGKNTFIRLCKFLDTLKYATESECIRMLCERFKVKEDVAKRAYLLWLVRNGLEKESKHE